MTALMCFCAVEFVIIDNNNHCSIIIQWPNSTVIGAIVQTKKWHKIDKANAQPFVAR